GRRGGRGDVDIQMTCRMGGAGAGTKEVSQMFVTALDDRGIEYAPKESVVRLDARRRRAHLASGGSLPYDLFIGIPVHRAPEVVRRSGLAVDGWVAVEQTNLSTRFPGV